MQSGEASKRREQHRGRRNAKKSAHFAKRTQERHGAGRKENERGEKPRTTRRTRHPQPERARAFQPFTPERLAERAAAIPVIDYPDLPVSARRDEIAAAIRDHQVVIVSGETGSGKTTQLPKICLQLGRGVTGMIGHTQPRRLAARSVADRIAAELGQRVSKEPGQVVGYQVRFTDEVGPTTLVKLMTDGILLAEIQSDPLLRRYDTLIIDEAHERSLNIDFILGYLARLLPARPDLKVIITSATIDSARFAEHFGRWEGTPGRGRLIEPAPVIEVSGRTFPVEIRYRPLAANGVSSYSTSTSSQEPSSSAEDSSSSSGFAARPLSSDPSEHALKTEQPLAKATEEDTACTHDAASTHDSAFVFTPEPDTTQLVLEDLDDDLPTLGYGLGEDIDVESAICHAVDELCAEGEGDILVFLPGERDIRDTEQALLDHLGTRGVRAGDTAKALPGSIEIVPLFARLSAAEQHRVFEEHRLRRVVLATNVAETSLTVPGIRYVIDPGLARVSRYSNRTKVQRLPIEAISRASANQRAGRCGRVADGIAIRLYSQGDYESRPRFTEPEILRTSLASVILQMAALGLGSVADFPFLDAPEHRAVRDGVASLVEIGALREEKDDSGRTTHRLTPIGRDLARLPIDPRLGRILLEGDANGCASEILVIVAALSIQDVRERPLEHQQAADAAHARFANPHSDFITYLNLWRYLNVQQRDLSGSQFRRLCRAEFLHYLRFREWRDVVVQLQQMARPLDLIVHPLALPSPADVIEAAQYGGAQDAAARAVVAFTQGSRTVDADDVHRSMLVGFLSNLGSWDEAKHDYQGARGARFTIWPGSGLARSHPAWVMTAELVETSRLFARTVARIDPAWVEPLAGHLLKRVYSEPYWSSSKGAAMTKEKLLLYGLTLVAERPVLLGRLGDRVIDEGGARNSGVVTAGTLAGLAQGLVGAGDERRSSRELGSVGRDFLAMALACAEKDEPGASGAQDEGAASAPVSLSGTVALSGSDVSGDSAVSGTASPGVSSSPEGSTDSAVIATLGGAANSKSAVDGANADLGARGFEKDTAEDPACQAPRKQGSPNEPQPEARSKPPAGTRREEAADTRAEATAQAAPKNEAELEPTPTPSASTPQAQPHLTAHSALTARELARDMFIRHALVAGEWRERHRFQAHNDELVEQAREVERRSRTHGLVADEEARFAFFDELIPDNIVSAAHFNRWWKNERRSHPELLDYTDFLLLPRGVGEASDGFPDTWESGGLELELSYAFTPGSSRDGVTLSIPIEVLERVSDEGTDWLVPGMREELITEMIRALPKAKRRLLAPAPEVGARAAAWIEKALAGALDPLEAGSQAPKKEDAQAPDPMSLGAAMDRLARWSQSTGHASRSGQGKSAARKALGRNGAAGRGADSVSTMLDSAPRSVASHSATDQPGSAASLPGSAAAQTDSVAPHTHSTAVTASNPTSTTSTIDWSHKRPAFEKAFATAIRVLRGVELSESDLSHARSKLPPHLLMTFVVLDSHGVEIGAGTDLVHLQRELAGRAEEAIRSAVRGAVAEAMLEASRDRSGRRGRGRARSAASSALGAPGLSGHAVSGRKGFSGQNGTPGLKDHSAASLEDTARQHSSSGQGTFADLDSTRVHKLQDPQATALSSHDSSHHASAPRTPGGKAAQAGSRSVSAPHGHISAGFHLDALTAFPETPLPRSIESPGSSATLRAFPALVAEGDAANPLAGVRVMANPHEAECKHREGLARLLLFRLRLQRTRVTTRWTGRQALMLAASPYKDTAALVDDAQLASALSLVDELSGEAGPGAIRDAGAFEELLARCRNIHEDRVYEILGHVVRAMEAQSEVDSQIRSHSEASMRPIVAEVEEHTRFLIHPGFLVETPMSALPHLARYLRAGAVRIERACASPGALHRDLEDMDRLHALEANLAEAEALASRRPYDSRSARTISSARWLLEELRVSVFAQKLGTPNKVSFKRVAALIESV
ncbi:DUF3418 domain-containing protein [Schaalia cardiffensis]